MKVKVSKYRNLYIQQDYNTQNENEANIIKLQVPEGYEDFNKKIVFITPEGTYWDLFQNDEYAIGKALTKYKSVQFYIWLTKGEQDFRSETRKITFLQNTDASEQITPEEIDGVNTVVNLLEEEITKVDNIDIAVNKIENIATITVTDKNGNTRTVEITDGINGQDGYTPQRGTDYWTASDIASIEGYCANYIDANINQMIGGSY